MQQKGTNHPRLPVSRRGLFSILPAGLAACIGCAVPDLCEAQTAPRTRERGPSEKSGMTWEEVFRFTYRDNYIPTLKVLQKQIGNERFISMLEQGLSEAAVAGMVGNRAPNRDFATWVKGMRSVLGTDHDSKPLPSFPRFCLSARPLQCRQEEYRSGRATAQGFGRSLLALPFAGARLRPTRRTAI